MGSRLYNYLEQYFTSYLKDPQKALKSTDNQSLLVVYANEWDRFKQGATNVDHGCAYFNRFWVKHEQQKGREKMHNVYILALAKVIGSFVTLGLIEKCHGEAQLDLYQRGFQGPFIEATERYYFCEHTIFFQSHAGTVPEYIKKVEEYLSEEEGRAEYYLHPSTREKLISKCEDALLRAHLGKLREDLQTLLGSDKDEEDLRRMCRLLSRIPGELDSLSKEFEEDVTAAGLAAIADLNKDSACSSGSDIQPKAYVDTLFTVYHKNQDIVSRRFGSEVHFTTSLDRACYNFINQNCATGTSSTRSSELLAKWVDTLMQTKGTPAKEGALEEDLNKVMTLFKYINDKDVFQAFYTAKLSRRLIYGLSASDDREASTISKLTKLCGSEYTNKLQRMFTDIQLSKDLTAQFKECTEVSHGTSALDIAFSAMVLGGNIWPLYPTAPNFIIPKSIIPTYERFQRYYQNKHSGRKLVWLWNYSDNELRTNYLSQNYIFITTSFQTAVLVQYNESDTQSLDELITATGISKELALQGLAALVKAKVLLNQATDRYDLNLSFNSKKIRVKLRQLITSEVKKEAFDMLKAVDEGRKYTIQATIVRIMKVSGTMNNQALIQEAMGQISTHFIPRISDIKKVLDKVPVKLRVFILTPEY
ncbi:unnamed protein product [Rhizoctonia solani]|uniref:Cullin family profile domain-containing protein n=1 Tax=Rhizoctonia solani TaxID=456999 RepID=A0A8H2Y250_9AGAM|nr:unnamed protein product [Rhizoctonia solani]